MTNINEIKHLKIYYPWDTKRVLADKKTVQKRFIQQYGVNLETLDDELAKDYINEDREIMLFKNEHLHWLERPEDMHSIGLIETYKWYERRHDKKTNQIVWRKRETEKLLHVDEPSFFEKPKEWYWYKISLHPTTLFTSTDDFPSLQLEHLTEYAIQNNIINLETESLQIINNALQFKFGET
eukprot:133373_1